VHADGTTFAQTSFAIAARAKFLRPLREILPDAAGETSGYIVIRSSTALYATGMIAALNNSSLTELPPAAVPAAFAPNAVRVVPSITWVEPSGDVLPGTTLQVSLRGASGDATFTLGGQVVNKQQIGPFGVSYEVTIPAMEPGFANLTVR